MTKITAPTQTVSSLAKRENNQAKFLAQIKPNLARATGEDSPKPKCTIQKEIIVTEYRDGKDRGIFNYLNSSSGLRNTTVRFDINAENGSTAMVKKHIDHKRMANFKIFSDIKYDFHVTGSERIERTLVEPFYPATSLDHYEKIYFDPQNDLNLTAECKNLDENGNEQIIDAKVLKPITKYNVQYSSE